MLKDAIPLDTLQRVLVIKLRHHGDVLLTSPVISALKKYAPQAEIDALIYADTAEMLSLHPALSEIHLIDRNGRRQGLAAYIRAEWQLLKALRSRHYDLIVHLTDHPRGAWITRLCGARWAVARRVGGRGNWWNKAFTHFLTTPRNALRHTAELNLDALRRLGLYPAPNERNLSLVPGPDAEARIASLLKELGCEATAFIHIHPASRWHFKCWPADSMAALINRLNQEGHLVILTAAQDSAEMRMIEVIQSKLERPALSLEGKLSLKELAALTARARLFIGVDSAPMHIAAAMGTPTVALFGPSGDKEWGPWKVAHRVVTSATHPCRPCGIDGCGGSKVSDCLVTLPIERVHQAVLELLSE
ncbi:MAG: putative lipopolysaccharide heptosyltransferase III [Betaproteobacteria bacterium]